MISLEEFAKIEANRAALYRFVAKLFRAPLTSEDIEMLAASDLATRAGDEAGIGHGLKVMGRYLAKRNTGTREMLGRDYTCAFRGAGSGGQGGPSLRECIHKRSSAIHG